jgi:hypothetical protein
MGMNSLPTKGGGGMSDRQKETEGLTGVQLWVQLGPVVVNDRGCLGYPVASSPREDDIMLIPNLDGHEPMTFDFTSV